MCKCAMPFALECVQRFVTHSDNCSIWQLQSPLGQDVISLWNGCSCEMVSSYLFKESNHSSPDRKNFYGFSVFIIWAQKLLSGMLWKGTCEQNPWPGLQHAVAVSSRIVARRDLWCMCIWLCSCTLHCAPAFASSAVCIPACTKGVSTWVQKAAEVSDSLKQHTWNPADPNLAHAVGLVPFRCDRFPSTGFWHRRLSRPGTPSSWLRTTHVHVNTHIHTQTNKNNAFLCAGVWNAFSYHWPAKGGAIWHRRSNAGACVQCCVRWWCELWCVHHVLAASTLARHEASKEHVPVAAAQHLCLLRAVHSCTCVMLPQYARPQA